MHGVQNPRPVRPRGRAAQRGLGQRPQVLAQNRLAQPRVGERLDMRDNGVGTLLLLELAEQPNLPLRVAGRLPGFPLQAHERAVCPLALRHHRVCQATDRVRQDTAVRSTCLRRGRPQRGEPRGRPALRDAQPHAQHMREFSWACATNSSFWNVEKKGDLHHGAARDDMNGSPRLPAANKRKARAHTAPPASAAAQRPLCCPSPSKLRRVAIPPVRAEPGQVCPDAGEMTDDKARAEALKLEGNAFLSAKDYASAEHCYTQAIAIDPGQPRANTYTRTHPKRDSNGKIVILVFAYICVCVCVFIHRHTSTNAHKYQHTDSNFSVCLCLCMSMCVSVCKPAHFVTKSVCVCVCVCV